MIDPRDRHPRRPNEPNSAAAPEAAIEQHYRLLTEALGEVVCHIRDGVFVLISGPVEDVLGAPAAHWIGREVTEIIPADDLPAYAARVQRLVGGGVLKERVRVAGVDGVAKWIHMHSKPFHDAQGSPDGYAATFRIVGDGEAVALEAAQEARSKQAQAEARYRRVIDNAAIGMCLIGPEGRFEEVNGALCQLFGYDAETLLQKTWQELTAPEYLEADLKNFDDIVRGVRESFRMIKQYIHADGHLIWGDLSVSCVRDEHGRVEHFISQIIDITATVDANERNHQLAQSLQRNAEHSAAELRSAAAYMSSIMPRGLDGRVRVSSRYLPSRELGGDCFHYSWIDDDHLLVYLIDVSGHGIEPALLSVSLHNMLRSGSLPAVNLLAPAAVLEELNRLFQMDQQNFHYFTMWFGIYEASTRTLTYSSAGAPPALAFIPTPGGNPTVTALSTKSAPVGMFEDTEFASRSYSVPSGCRILLCSDGAIEIPLADNRHLTLPEFTRLNARLAGSPDWSPDDLIEELRALSLQGRLDDDCSLIQMTFD